jgi:hypothetical protein
MSQLSHFWRVKTLGNRSITVAAGAIQSFDVLNRLVRYQNYEAIMVPLSMLSLVFIGFSNFCCHSASADDPALQDRRVVLDAASTISNASASKLVTPKKIEEAKQSINAIGLAKRPYLKRVLKHFELEQRLSTASTEVERIIQLGLEAGGMRVSADATRQIANMGLETLLGGDPDTMEYTKKLTEPVISDVIDLLDVHLISIQLKQQAASEKRQLCNVLAELPGRTQEADATKPFGLSIRYAADSDTAIATLRNVTKEIMTDCLLIVDMPCTCNLNPQRQMENILIPGIMGLMFDLENTNELSQGYVKRDKAFAAYFDEDKASFAFISELKPNETLQCVLAMAPAILYADSITAEVLYNTDKSHLAELSVEALPLKKRIAKEAGAAMQKKQQQAMKAAKAKSRIKR